MLIDLEIQKDQKDIIFHTKEPPHYLCIL